MRFLPALLTTLCLAMPAVAADVERSKAFDDKVVVHYNLFNSTFLQPEVSSASGLPRDEQQHLLNVAPMQDGKPLADAQVTGSVQNLLGQVSELQFKRISEPGAQYFIAPVDVTSREILMFKLKVTAPQRSYDLEFSQEVFPEEK